VTEVICAPATVPASVVWILALFASRTMGPETLAPL
jgi:hypothetical protein